jgi:2-methylcitrate dehydratase
MKTHIVRARCAAEEFPRSGHLATKIAEVAADQVEVTAEVGAMIIDRIIDNAAVAAASLRRHPVTAARAQATAQPYRPRTGR